MEICRDRPLTNGGGQPSPDAEESFPAFPPIKSQLASAKNSESRQSRLKTIKTHLNFPETEKQLHPSI
jgi:hypothetical protein